MLSTVAGVLVAHPGFGTGGGPGWWIVFPIVWFLLVLMVVVLVARRVRRGWVTGGPWVHHAGPDPVSILGERYARGEIDEAEYRTRLAVLRPDASR